MAEVTAYITEENGQLVLHDPMAAAMAQVIAEHNRNIAYENCQQLHDLNLDRIQYFRQRFDTQGYQPRENCIVILQVDDPYGRAITDILMPGYNWQEIRDQGAEPIARGIAGREFMTEALKLFDPDAAAALAKPEYAVIVVADSVARVFAV